MTIQFSDLAVGNTTLHVREHLGSGTGHRPALLFLHYFGGSGRTWEPVMEILAANGWRCLAPDLRGFGASPAPRGDWTHYTVETMASDIRALADRLRLDRFVVVGHSMGGKVALALAAQQPAGLVGIALLAPSPPTPEPMKDAERARLLAGHADEAAARETLEKITAHRLPQPLSDLAVVDSLHSSASAWHAWLEHGSREDISRWMTRVAARVHIAVGEKDRSITAALVEREVRTRLTHLDTSLVSVPAAGHLLPLETPAAVAAFLSSAFEDAGETR